MYKRQVRYFKEDTAHPEVPAVGNYITLTGKADRIDPVFRTLQAVSYTHLDVYKRQYKYRARHRTQGGMKIMFYEIMHRESCVAQLSTTGECLSLIHI